MSNKREIGLLEDILQTLREMKKQEYDYWETWKKKKEKEVELND